MFLKRKKKYSDIEIVQEIRRGNSDGVLRFLYTSVQPKLTHWIMRNSGSEDEAQDIFQDAVLSFYEYVLEGKFEEGKSVDGFIFSIGRNKWINRAKQLNKNVSSTEFEESFVADEVDAFSDANSSDKSEKIESLLKKLGERCKELLTKSIFYNMKMVDIASTMGFSTADAAKTKNYKCKKRLMKMIKDDDQIKGWLFND